jgi:nucleolar protein 15
MTRDEWGVRVEREQRKRVEKAEKLREVGYEFSMPVMRGVEDVAVKVREVEGGEVEGEGEGVKVLANGEDAEKGGSNGVTVVEEKVTKKRPAHGKTETKKKVKKIKT